MVDTLRYKDWLEKAERVIKFDFANLTTLQFLYFFSW